MKASGEQFDERIVEVHWDPQHEHWRLMRFRDDKPTGNYKTVVENIIQSIADGVEKETLVERSSSIRNAWKARHSDPRQPPPPPQARTLPPKPPQPIEHALPAKPQPPQAQSPTGPQAEARYGPLAPSRWSKVTGPETVAGMYR